MMGYLRSEIMELNWEILDHPDDLSANFKLFEGAASGTESTPIQWIEVDWLF